ncbi:MAG: DNA-processing protein DprA [Polyangiales bacterium]
MVLSTLLHRVRTIACDDSRFPARFRDLGNPPTSIRVLGPLGDELLKEDAALPAVAIVGTRRATNEALDFAYDLARQLAKQNIVIVSGGALGIDSAAHQGALDAHGRTIAVLPTGLANPYPARNRALLTKVAEHGALLTEASEDEEPYPSAFLNRNRLIAALSVATVVVEAPNRSGALSTAAHALVLKRPLLIVPSAPWTSRNRGGLGLLRQGARICIDASDVLSVAVIGPGSAQRKFEFEIDKPNNINKLSAPQQQVMLAISAGGLTIDDLCDATGIAIDALQATILELQLRGRIAQQGDKIVPR